MDFSVDSNDFVDYLKLSSEVLSSEKETIGNLSVGENKDYGWNDLADAYKSILVEEDILRELPVYVAMRRVGLLLLSKIGLDAAMLYGSSYVSAAEVIDTKVVLSLNDIVLVLDTICEDMIKRGKLKPGYGSSVDALSPAVSKLKAGIAEKTETAELLEAVKTASVKGFEATRDMSSPERENKEKIMNVGAFVMKLKICCLCDYLIEKKTK